LLKPHACVSAFILQHGGELRHKEQWYPAEHLPIIDRKFWESVQAILSTNYWARGGFSRAKVDFLLKGIVFGNDGRALSPFHTKKSLGDAWCWSLQ